MTMSETTPLLKCLDTNFKSEKEQTGDHPLLTFQKGNLFGVQDTQDDKVLKYSMSRLGSWWALLYYKDTFFVDKELWKIVSVHVVICIVMCCTVYLNVYTGFHLGRLASDKNLEALSSVAACISVVVGFLLGMFVSGSVSRWWSMRNGCLGGLWGAVDDLTLILSAHMPNKRDRAAKENVLRLSLLSVRLLFAQAQGKESWEDLQQIVDRGLMTPEEKEALLGMPSKPQVVWVWIAQTLHELADAGKIKYKEVMMPELDMLCARARGSIGGAFAYTDTQVPFNYVHLLVVSVFLSNITLSVKCGLIMGREFFHVHGDGSYYVAFAQLLQVIIVPFVYSAFLKINEQLESPFGNDPMDFPALSYHVYMRDECHAFIRSGENMPKSVLEKV